MPVLQECSICFEEFDGWIVPQTTPCGHIFCDQCLDILSLSPKPKCPNCRASFTRNQVMSLEKMELRKSLKTLAEVDRQSQGPLVEELVADVICKGDVSKYIQIAVDVFQQLVRTERENDDMKTKLINAEAIHEKLATQNKLLVGQLRKLELQFSNEGPRARPVPRVSRPATAYGNPGALEPLPERQVEGPRPSEPRDQIMGGINEDNRRTHRGTFEVHLPPEPISREVQRQGYKLSGFSTAGTVSSLTAGEISQITSATIDDIANEVVSHIIEFKPSSNIDFTIRGKVVVVHDTENNRTLINHLRKLEELRTRLAEVSTQGHSRLEDKCMSTRSHIESALSQATSFFIF
ncbi:unnamed protein product [Rhizoctonia solani]|uniref:RING-type domain-containing protein n=1 Tax=Rhizoctonia solani TaxID=456999 RepID=A0A8H3HCS2_9AGAM|nr:unnamed protein product [Rhizoctonia solani]